MKEAPGESWGLVPMALKDLKLYADIMRAAGKEPACTKTTRRRFLDQTGIDVADFGFAIHDDDYVAPGTKRVLICVEHKAGSDLLYPDNETGPCHGKCGKQLQWRPDGGTPSEAPKVCKECVISLPSKAYLGE